jgi:hypothetical protein
MPSNTTDVDRVTFCETDEAGNPTATYVFSPPSKTSPARVDKIVSVTSWLLFLALVMYNGTLICQNNRSFQLAYLYASICIEP